MNVMFDAFFDAKKLLLHLTRVEDCERVFIGDQDALRGDSLQKEKMERTEKRADSSAILYKIAF